MSSRGDRTLTDGVVLLRPPSPTDAEDVARAVFATLPELRAYMPWASDAYDVESARQWIASVAAGAEHGFLVFEVDDPRTVVGSCGLNQLDPLNLSANLGYWIRTANTGRGLATRATRLVARFGHDDLGLHCIRISASVENVASCRVAERAGGRLDGTVRGRLLLGGRHHDARLYTLLPGEVTDDPGW
ncbi:MAG TPA: GNAT family N-acetyltransferase [Acidimicrobiia bacterium]|nr:GNAT family N-acetyltransferase [Acidimicrobiia bacterium]